MQATGTAVDPAAPAASAPFPARWADDFEASTVESLPKYWAYQCGSFQIMPSSGGRTGNSILQRVPMHPGHNKWHENLKNPLTILGATDGAKGPTKFSIEIRAPAAAFPHPPVPPPGPPPRWHPAPLPPPSGAWLCGRVSSVGHNQNMGGVYRGMCLQINATAAAGGMSWRVEKDGAEIMASGELAAGSLSA